jgi:hypothetical protein
MYYRDGDAVPIVGSRGSEQRAKGEHVSQAKSNWVVLKSLQAVLIGGFVVAISATVADAHGGASAKVHSCVTKLGGVVRVVDATNTCLLTESPLDWDIQGPPGLPGPQGTQGVQGPQGPKGATGGVGATIIRRVDHVLADGQTTLANQGNVACQPGEQPVGGGASFAETNHGDARLTGSGPRTGTVDAPHVPEDGSTWTVWRATAINPVDSDPGPVTVRVYIICAPA